MGFFASKKGSYCQPPERRRMFPNKSRFESSEKKNSSPLLISTFSPFKAPQIAITSPDPVEIRDMPSPAPRSRRFCAAAEMRVCGLRNQPKDWRPELPTDNLEILEYVDGKLWAISVEYTF